MPRRQPGYSAPLRRTRSASRFRRSRSKAGTANGRARTLAQTTAPGLLHRIDRGKGFADGEFCTLTGLLRAVYGSLVIEVRAMDLADIGAVSALRVSGWQSAYAGIVPQSYLDAMSAEEDAAQRRQWFAAAGNQVDNLVATEDAIVTGWAAIGPRTGDPSVRAAEIHALYVRPDRIGTGTGRRLMEAARSWAVERGYLGLELWVLAGNVRAQRFYARAGFSPDGAERVEEYDGVPLKDLHYVGDAHVPL